MPLLATLIVVALTVATVALAARRAWPRWRAVAVERLAEPARAWLSPPQQVPLATLQRRWISRALHHVTVTVSGRAALPSGLVMAVAPADLERLGDVTDLLAEDTEAVLRRKARRHDWLVPEGFGILVDADPDVVEGRPQARVRRTAEARPAATGAPSGPALTVQARTLLLPAGKPPADRTAVAPSPELCRNDRDRTRAFTACELIALDGGRAVDLVGDRAVLTVGREPGNDLVLDDAFVSGAHAELVRRGGQWVVVDRSSCNGTWVNGERVVEAALVHNDEISFGWSGPRYVFSRLSPELPAVR